MVDGNGLCFIWLNISKKNSEEIKYGWFLSPFAFPHEMR